jgi:transcription elongation factor Elf1
VYKILVIRRFLSYNLLTRSDQQPIYRNGGMFMAALIKCPNCGSTRIETLGAAQGLAGKMGKNLMICNNCGRQFKQKSK